MYKLYTQYIDVFLETPFPRRVTYRRFSIKIKITITTPVLLKRLYFDIFTLINVRGARIERNAFVLNTSLARLYVNERYR